MQEAVLFLGVIFVILVVPTVTILLYELYIKDKVKAFFLRWIRLTQQIIKSLGDLRGWLTKNQIDSSEWGKGVTKTIHDLWREIEIGDARLGSGGRVVDVAVVIIRSGEKVLIETKQTLSGDRTRQRQWPPSEKFQTNENAKMAALRCLQEELRLEDKQIKSIKPTLPPIVESAPSPSYPGLNTQYHLHLVEAEVTGLPQREFTTEELPESHDGFVKWHSWKWGDLPANFAHLAT